MVDDGNAIDRDPQMRREEVMGSGTPSQSGATNPVQLRSGAGSGGRRIRSVLASGPAFGASRRGEKGWLFPAD